MRQLPAVVLALAATLAVAPAPRAEQDPPPAGTMSIQEIIARVGRAESAVTARMRAFHPLVEVYIQTVASDEQSLATPTHDEYFLGRFDWKDGPNLKPLSASKGTTGGAWSQPFSIKYLPDGFAAMSVPDWRLLTADRYQFTFVRREFLGEARCLVFDVSPRGDRNDGFTGRIWVEDREFNIVRFNGISRHVDQTLSRFLRKKVSFHVDSWRTNVRPSYWLPSYVYCEETDLGSGITSSNRARIKSQVRFWGYAAAAAQGQQTFTSIQIDAPTVKDEATPSAQITPVESQRMWEQEAEDNIIDRLGKSGLLAPPSPVDKILETVVNNLVVTNGLTLDAPVRCRVLLTSPLESFTVGHTIVLSRGLIDVLPDEASLAMMLGHELSHIVLGHSLVDTKYAFADRLMVGDGDLLNSIQLRHTPAEEDAADAKVIELLKKSPYKDKLANAGLFLRAVSAYAKELTNLIQPHIGERLASGGQVVRLTELMEQAPALAPEKLDQIAALPLGGRLVVDPWTGRVDLLRAAAVPLVSAREKVPFAVTPLMQYIKYAAAPGQATAQR